MTFDSEKPFAELPARLIEEVLQRTEDVSLRMLDDFQTINEHRIEWRSTLESSGLLQSVSNLQHVSPPTTCGVDGSYAVEHLLSSDLVVAAAVAVEGLTPPSEERYWPEPTHQVVIETEPHVADVSSILRALMIGMELELAGNAPHDLVFIDGSLSTPVIFFNQGLNKINETSHLSVTQTLIQRFPEMIRAFLQILSSTRSDHSWVAVPKYTSRREIGNLMNWPSRLDDKALLSLLLNPGEYTAPQHLQNPEEPWHINISPLENRSQIEETVDQIITLINEIRMIFYRPFPWSPAIRLETSVSVCENSARLSTLLTGVRDQCGTSAIIEPYPLYMADRMVKHLPRAIPTFRQISSQRISEIYEGDINDIFLGLHGYRTEGR